MELPGISESIWKYVEVHDSTTPDMKELGSVSALLFLQAVKVGDIVFVGQYLFTGSETTSVWLTVRDTNQLLTMVNQLTM